MRRLNWFEVALGIMVIGFMTVSVTKAQTPDGETPAEESVCDPLQAKDVTPGLYGICIAFCEAQDWERCLDNPDTCGQSAAALLEAYENRRSPADPDMPCVISASQCPCWDGSTTAFPGGANLAEIWSANAPLIA